MIEQDHPEQIDHIVSSLSSSKLPVVGLGGSAGGLAALQAFFGAMAPDCGMAFVVIMHLSPEHDSILAEVLQPTTTMPVRQVQGRTRVEANHVYVIPPGKHLSMADGHLALSDLARARPGKHVAVDLFFRTLADTHGPHAAAIVFSARTATGDWHQTSQGARRPHRGAGPRRGRARLHAALDHRHRHGGLGAACRRDARQALRILAHRTAPAPALRGRPAARARVGASR